MAAAAPDSRVSAGKKPKTSLKKKKKKIKMVARAVASELKDEDKEAADIGGAAGTRRPEEDPSSSDDGAADADSEGEAEPRDRGDGGAAEARVGASQGWADAMARILHRKTPGSKPPILVKNKELEKEKAKLKQERLERRKQLDKKREWDMMCRVKPDVQDKEAERNLQRIATRGVVQLFNAVQKHQKNVDEKVKEAGSSIRKRAKLMSAVSKKDFISVLRGTDGAAGRRGSPGGAAQARQTKGKEDGPGWTVLRDDFMMGASMKDWDREGDGPDDSQLASARGSNT